MQQQHVENISTLIHFMDGLNDPKFDMGRFVHGCGTPACALGWACTVPALKDVGLELKVLKEVTSTASVLEMVHRVFGEVFGDLFAGNRSITTPQEWADHARELLRMHGHKVVAPSTAQKNDFARFMERTLKPVALPKEISA